MLTDSNEIFITTGGHPIMKPVSHVGHVAGGILK